MINISKNQGFFLTIIYISHISIVPIVSIDYTVLSHLRRSTMESGAESCAGVQLHPCARPCSVTWKATREDAQARIAILVLKHS